MMSASCSRFRVSYRFHLGTSTEMLDVVVSASLLAKAIGLFALIDGSRVASSGLGNSWRFTSGAWEMDLSKGRPQWSRMPCSPPFKAAISPVATDLCNLESGCNPRRTLDETRMFTEPFLFPFGHINHTLFTYMV